MNTWKLFEEREIEEKENRGGGEESECEYMKACKYLHLLGIGRRLKWITEKTDYSHTSCHRRHHHPIHRKKEKEIEIECYMHNINVRTSIEQTGG